MKHLIAIQKKLKAPKNQYNKFGNYYYRSAEDILEALKPICHEEGCVFYLTDDIVTRGEGADIRYYVEAKAVLITPDRTFEVKAYAREELTKKGMDASQITGAASTYARKYAMNGLFNIDDNKDMDTPERRSENNNRAQAQANTAPAPSQTTTTLTKEQLIEKVVMLADTKRIRVSDLCAKANPPVIELADMDETRLATMVDWLMQQN